MTDSTNDPAEIRSALERDQEAEDQPLNTPTNAAELPALSRDDATKLGWRDLKYTDSTPELHIGDSAFEDWFQQQHFATLPGIKQLSRDSYAAGMGDPLVIARAAQPTVAVPGWQPIETAPKDGTPVIIGRDGVHAGVMSFPHEKGYVKVARFGFLGGDWGMQPLSSPTHWMPLPAAPGKATP